MITNKDKILHLAAKVDQIYNELVPIWEDKNIAMMASHEAGVTLGVIRSLSSRLQKLSVYPGMDKETDSL